LKRVRYFFKFPLDLNSVQIDFALLQRKEDHYLKNLVAKVNTENSKYKGLISTLKEQRTQTSKPFNSRDSMELLNQSVKSSSKLQDGESLKIQKSMLKRIDEVELEKRKQFDHQEQKTQDTLQVVRQMKQKKSYFIFLQWKYSKFRKQLRKRIAARKIIRLYRYLKREKAIIKI